MLEQVTKVQTITADTIAGAMTYQEYKDLADRLFAQGKTT